MLPIRQPDQHFCITWAMSLDGQQSDCLAAVGTNLRSTRERGDRIDASPYLLGGYLSQRQHLHA